MSTIHKIVCLVVVCPVFILSGMFSESTWARNEPDLTVPVISALPKHKEVEGTWLGTVNVFSLELVVIFRICRDNQGTLTGTIDSPAQGAIGVPADKVTFRGGKLHVVAKAIPSVFEGKMKEDGLVIEGQWQQSGYSFPLVAKRVSEAELLEVLEDRSYTKVFSSEDLKQDL